MPPPPSHSEWFIQEVRPHEPALRAYLRATFPSLSDVDDLVQETYARLFRARDAGKVVEARPYLFATARNAALDIFRRRRVVQIQSLQELEDPPADQETLHAAESISLRQEIDLLAEAVRSLPTRCRLVLTLRKIKGWSHREIAAKLGISEKTVNAQLAIGMVRCRAYLQERGVEKGHL